jgi:hypothetical protein
MIQKSIADRDKYKSKDSESKTLWLSLITFLVYATIGFCLASIGINLIWWLLTVLLYHWYLSKQSLENFSTLIVIASLNLAIINIIDRAKLGVSLESSSAIAFFATINALISMKLTMAIWGKSKAIALETLIAWLGLILGWLLFHSSFIV